MRKDTHSDGHGGSGDDIDVGGHTEGGSSKAKSHTERPEVFD